MRRGQVIGVVPGGEKKKAQLGGLQHPSLMTLSFFFCTLEVVAQHPRVAGQCQNACPCRVPSLGLKCPGNICSCP
jgi:hypothetical protein